jgi:hypothetical protein
MANYNKKFDNAWLVGNYKKLAAETSVSDEEFAVLCGIQPGTFALMLKGIYAVTVARRAAINAAFSGIGFRPDDSLVDGLAVEGAEGAVSSKDLSADGGVAVVEGSSVTKGLSANGDAVTENGGGSAVVGKGSAVGNDERLTGTGSANSSAGGAVLGGKADIVQFPISPDASATSPNQAAVSSADTLTVTHEAVSAVAEVDSVADSSADSVTSSAVVADSEVVVVADGSDNSFDFDFEAELTERVSASVLEDLSGTVADLGVDSTTWGELKLTVAQLAKGKQKGLLIPGVSVWGSDCEADARKRASYAYDLRDNSAVTDRASLLTEISKFDARVAECEEKLAGSVGKTQSAVAARKRWSEKLVTAQQRLTDLSDELARLTGGKDAVIDNFVGFWSELFDCVSRNELPQTSFWLASDFRWRAGKIHGSRKQFDLLAQRLIELELIYGFAAVPVASVDVLLLLAQEAHSNVFETAGSLVFDRAAVIAQRAADYQRGVYGGAEPGFYTTEFDASLLDHKFTWGDYLSASICVVTLPLSGKAVRTQQRDLGLLRYLLSARGSRGLPTVVLSEEGLKSYIDGDNSLLNYLDGIRFVDYLAAQSDNSCALDVRYLSVYGDTVGSL